MSKPFPVQQKDRTITSDIEHLLADTIAHVAEMREWQKEHDSNLSEIPSIKILLQSAVAAQVSNADSQKRLATLLEKIEERQEHLEDRLQRANDVAAGKDQIPLRSHYWTVVVALLPAIIMCLATVLYVLWSTKQELTASLTQVEIRQQQLKESVDAANKATEEVKKDDLKK